MQDEDKVGQEEAEEMARNLGNVLVAKHGFSDNQAAEALCRAAAWLSRDPAFLYKMADDFDRMAACQGVRAQEEHERIMERHRVRMERVAELERRGMYEAAKAREPSTTPPDGND